MPPQQPLHARGCGRLLLLLSAFVSAGADDALSPLAGTAAGGSIRSTLASECATATHCIFGPSYAVATPLVRTSAHWSCDSPSALDTGAAAIAGLVDVRRNASLHGAAAWEGDVAHLTNTRGYDQVGTLVMAAPLERTRSGLDTISIAFELLVGRGTGGEGLSISLVAAQGPVRHADERGLPDGLVVTLNSASERVSVRLRGEVILERRLDGRDPVACDRYNCANCPHRALCAESGCDWSAWQSRCHRRVGQPLLHAFRTRSYVPVHLAIIDERLSVWHSGYQFVRSLPLNGWRHMVVHGGRLTLALGARTSLRTDDHWVRGLELVQGALVGEARTTVALADAADADASAACAHLNLTYFARPVVSRIQWPLGPVSGGTPVTVHGEHLHRGSASGAACAFGEQHVAATRRASGTLECVAPPSNATGESVVEVTLNGVDTTHSSTPHRFTYTAPQLERVEPNRTSTVHPTPLTLIGAGLGGGVQYRCRFGLTDANASGSGLTVPAFFDVARGTVGCTAPARPPGEGLIVLPVEVALNAVDFTSSARTLTYHPLPHPQALSPTTGPDGGATLVTVSGNFAEATGWVRRRSHSSEPCAPRCRPSAIVRPCMPVAARGDYPSNCPFAYIMHALPHARARIC